METAWVEIAFPSANKLLRRGVAPILGSETWMA